MKENDNSFVTIKRYEKKRRKMPFGEEDREACWKPLSGGAGWRRKGKG